ncbi:hypothetical protein EVAR_28888_1 [Eumeta japonica]|uniref:Secreted protein n=1 Tax=Eumeta variegata TaxID=151549 RepID=A0A4C1WXW6_EUMVA|nr:hypothetical protein EVAR_28888_1 [Eumeta japonica]
MALAVKITAIILIVCFVALFDCEPVDDHAQPELQVMEVKSVHKRSLDHEDGDGNDAMIQPALENAYDHRIRVLPGRESNCWSGAAGGDSAKQKTKTARFMQAHPENGFAHLICQNHHNYPGQWR